MKLCTFKNNGSARVGVVLNGDKKVADITLGYAALLKERGKLKARDIADILTPPSMLGLIEAGEEGLTAVKELRAAYEVDQNRKGPDGEEVVFNVSEIRVCAPLSNPSKILCPALTHKQGFNKVKRPPGVSRIRFILSSCPVASLVPSTLSRYLTSGLSEARSKSRPSSQGKGKTSRKNRLEATYSATR